MDYEQQEVNDKPSNLQILFIEFAVIFFVIAIPYFFYGLYKDTHVDEEKKVKRVLNRMGVCAGTIAYVRRICRTH